MWRTMHSPSEPWECPVKVLVTEEEFHHSDCLQGNPTWSLQEEQNCVSMYSSTCSSARSQLFSHSRFRQVQISNTNAVRIVMEWWNAGSKLGNETMCILWSFPSVGTFHCRPVHNRHTFWVSSLSHSIYLSRMMLQLNILDKCCRSCKYSF